MPGIDTGASGGERMCHVVAAASKEVAYSAPGLLTFLGDMSLRSGVLPMRILARTTLRVAPQNGSVRCLSVSSPRLAVRRHQAAELKAKLFNRLNIDPNEAVAMPGEAAEQLSPELLSQYESFMAATQPPARDLILSAIQQLYNAKDNTRMLNLFFRMTKDFGIIPDSTVALNVFFATGTVSELNRVLEIIIPLLTSGQMTLTPILYDRVLVALMDTAQYDLAMKLWSVFDSAPLFEPLPGTLYNMMLVGVRTEDVMLAQRMMSRLHASRGALPLGGWQVYLDFLFRSRLSKPIRVAWYEHGVTAQLASPQFRYFFMAAEELADPAFGDSVLAAAKGTKEKLDPNLLLPALRIHRVLGRIQEAEAIVAEMSETRHQRLSFAYAILLSMYTKLKLWDKAASLWETIAANSSVEINSATLAAGLSFSMLKKDFVAAESLFLELDTVMWNQVRGHQAATMLAYLNLVETPFVQQKAKTPLITGRLPTFLVKLGSLYSAGIRRADSVHALGSKSLSFALVRVFRRVGPLPAWIDLMSLVLSDPFPNLAHAFFHRLLPMLRDTGALSQAEVTLILNTLEVCDVHDTVTMRLRIDRKAGLKFAALWQAIIEARLRALDADVARDILNKSTTAVLQDEIAETVQELVETDSLDEDETPVGDAEK